MCIFAAHPAHAHTPLNPPLSPHPSTLTVSRIKLLGGNSVSGYPHWSPRTNQWAPFIPQTLVPAGLTELHVPLRGNGTLVKDTGPGDSRAG